MYTQEIHDSAQVSTYLHNVQKDLRTYRHHRVEKAYPTRGNDTMANLIGNITVVKQCNDVY